MMLKFLLYIVHICIDAYS